MDKKQFLQGIEKIQLAYNVNFSSEKLKLWYDSLKNMSFEKYMGRVNELIKTNKYIPNIAEILDYTGNAYEGRNYNSFDFNSLYCNFKGE